MFESAQMRRLMQEHNVKGADLARRAGCSPVTISRIRNGRQQPSTALAEQIAEALGVEVEQFYGDQAPSTGKQTPEQWKQKIAKVVDRLDEMGQAQVWAFAAGLEASRGGVSAALAASELEEAAQRAKRSSGERARNLEE